MYCSKCGKEVNGNAMICVHCGCLLDGYTLEQLNAPLDQKPVEKKKTNVCALVGFILSLVGFVFGFYLYVVLIAGFILSIIGMVQSKKLDSGKGFAIAGIVISSVSLAFWLIILIALFSQVFVYLFSFFIYLIFGGAL